MSSDHRPLPRAERDRLHFVRWVLLLVNAAGAAGIGQLTRKQLHLLLFLSFASSRLRNRAASAASHTHRARPVLPSGPYCPR